MGQQQILLIVLSVILVGIAVAVGIQMFRAQSVASNQDALVMDIINISALAFQYRLRPATMGGGSGTYEGFILPPMFRENDNGMYMAEIFEEGNEEFVRITGVSKLYGRPPTGFDEESGEFTGFNENEASFIRAVYDRNMELVNSGFEKEGWN